MFVVAIVLGITIHEFAHAITADRLGDDTPRAQGRVTLSPFAHLDPIGSIFMLVSYFAGVGVGWGRPVQTNPRMYRIDRRIAGSMVAFAGPLSNLVLATILSGVLRLNLFPAEDAYTMLLVRVIETNILLFFFNLIPLFPLDGSHLLANAMPPAMAETYYQLMRQWGYLIFIGLVMSRVLTPLIVVPSDAVFTFLTGWS